MQQTKAYLKFEVEIERDGEEYFVFIKTADDSDPISARLLNRIIFEVERDEEWFLDHYLPVPTPEQERENQECEEFHRKRDESA